MLEVSKEVVMKRNKRGRVEDIDMIAERLR